MLIFGVFDPSVRQKQRSSTVVSSTLKMIGCMRAGYSTDLPGLINIMEKPVSRVSFKVD